FRRPGRARRGRHIIGGNPAYRGRLLADPLACGEYGVLFLRQWGPGIALGIVAAQLAAPHLRGSVMTGIFSLLCLVFAARFAFPERFRPITEQPPAGGIRNIAAAAIGLFSGLAGVGGGILTNIVMSLSGISIRKSIGRAAAAGVVVGLPATIVA